jgi:sulfide:quinone oxidoreductase
MKSSGPRIQQHFMSHHQILIVGGGAAGLTAASQRKRARPELEVADP